MLETKPQILLHHLNFTVQNDRALLRGLDLALSARKTGLIGRNGMGKSSLLKLIVGELIPDAGHVYVNGSIAYCPQQFPLAPNTTVAQVFGIEEKLKALTAITNGSLDEDNFKLIGDDWSIKERAQQQLDQFNLMHLDLDTKIKHLSGGERTRLYLASTFFADADFTLLDEPTNNLDITAKETLYNRVLTWKKGLLIVSHDRTLLNFMDEIIEITTKEVQTYGGNYDDYAEQKNLQHHARERDLTDAKKALVLSQSSIQASREKREHRQSRGRKAFLTGKVDKLSANSKRGRSERTECRLVTQSEMLLKNANQKLKEAKSNIEVIEKISVSLPKTYVPNQKIVLEIENLTFIYPNQNSSSALIHQFNLKMAGPERIALVGPNGSGKTTLIKLILNQLPFLQGKITLGVDQVSYLDQQINLLDGNLSLLDNFLKLNPASKNIDAHHALAKFLFRNVTVNKLVTDLSGGEKLRAALACVLMTNSPPKLLILNEPTNYLDLESIASIESALSCYQGAMIIISHDMTFLKNIKISRQVYAPFNAS